MRMLRLAVLCLMVGTLVSSTRPGVLYARTDPISGQWDATLDGQGIPLRFRLKLKLVGRKVTGTSESSHVGNGTISKGLWVSNKLSFTINTADATIVVTGTLKDGKLNGEYNAGKLSGTWKAERMER